MVRLLIDVLSLNEQRWLSFSSLVQVAAHHLAEPEAAALYLQRARELEAKAHFKEAEKLYIEAQEHDLAINMYTKARQFDHVIQLVSKYRRVSCSSRQYSPSDFHVIRRLGYSRLLEYQ